MFQSSLATLCETHSIVLVDFGADWCSACKALRPVIAELEKTEQFRLMEVNLSDEANQEIAVAYNVSSLPALIFIKGGKEVSRLVGATSRQQIEHTISQLA